MTEPNYRYLRRWAADLGVSDLLEQAILQAGLANT